MIILGHWDTRPVTVSVKPNCITISLDDPKKADVFSYDYAGRLWTAFLDGTAYRRGLDGRMVAKRRNPGEARERRWLNRPEALAIEELARGRVAGLYAAIQTGKVQLNVPLPPLGCAGIEQAIAFDSLRSQADVEAYHQVYQPVGILPPDQYMAVVLQATEGCSFNTCTFCSFYKDRPFRVKKPDEFRAHAQAVRDFLGQGLSLRRTIFLGDANALVVPMPKLMPLLDEVHTIYDVASLGGIHAFLDGFSGEKKTEVDYRLLARKGLARVYVGLESGCNDLLAFLKKPGKAEDSVQAVRAMKAAGVAVGVIVLLGAGGHTYADAHIRDTINTLNLIGLDGDDILYFSELVVDDDLPYARDAYQAGLKPLSVQERLVQGEMIEDGLRFTGQSPKISPYDIREFIY